MFLKTLHFMGGVQLYKTLLQKPHFASVGPPIVDFLLLGALRESERERERESERERERERESGSASYVFWRLFVPLYHMYLLAGAK
jgi:hypothetical protein